MAAERLQKILAAAGLGSRRACEAMILEGRVTVEGRVIRELGTRADPAAQRILCDGQPVQAEKHGYWLLYKPVGHVCTSSDPEGRPLAIDLAPPGAGRVYTVGRLDSDSEGLIILTNDGDFAHRVMHPRHEVTKTYHAQVQGEPMNSVLQRLTTEGVWMDGRATRADAVRRMRGAPGEVWIEITLHEGRNREVRRILWAIGHRVIRLVRVKIGNIHDDRLGPGACRPLTPQEIRSLMGGPPPRSDLSANAPWRGGPRDRPRGV